LRGARLARELLPGRHRALHRWWLGVGADAVAGGTVGGAPLPCTGLRGHPGAVCRGYICVLILISGLVSESLPTGAGLVVMGRGFRSIDGSVGGAGVSG